MKHHSLAFLILASFFLAGCNRDDEKKPVLPANNTPAVPAAKVDGVAPAGASAASPMADDPDAAIVRSAGRLLNEAKDAIDTAKVDEAEAKLKDLERLKSKLTPEQQAQLRSYRIVLEAAKKMLRSKPIQETHP